MDVYKNILRKHLKNLKESDFVHFKHHLKDKGRLEWSCLENSDCYGTVEQIVQVYTIADRGKVVLDILRDMNLNQTALDMENDLNNFHRLHGQDEVRNPDVENKHNSRGIRNPGPSPDTAELFWNRDEALHDWREIRLKHLRTYMEMLIEEEEKRLAAWRKRTLWKSDDMKAKLSGKTPLILERMRAIQKDIETAKILKGEKKTVLKMLQEEMNLYRRFKVVFDRSADRLEVLDTEEEITEEFEKLRQFLRDEEAAWRAAQEEEEEQQTRKRKRAFGNTERQCSSRPSAISVR